MRERSALVTGATGFVGRNLAARLLSAGWQVAAVVRPLSDRTALECLSRLSVHVHDGTTRSADEIVAAAKPAVVFHLASLFRAEHTADDLHPLVESNILFPAQLLEAMAKHGVKHLINTGTAWQHYHAETYRPVCLYAATKQAFQDLLEYYADAAGLRAVTLKLFDTYGPGDTRKKLFSLFEAATKNGEPVDMSLGEQEIDLVYIDDVIDAFVVAAERVVGLPAGATESFAVSGGTPLPLREVAELYGRLAGAPLPIRWGARPYRKREVMHPWEGRQLPGWSPRYDLESGIKLMLQSKASAS